jgi:hypothetical protein
MLDSNYLRTEAERCFRLARGLAGANLSDELEEIGRAFEREADELEQREQDFETLLGHP